MKSSATNSGSSICGAAEKTRQAKRGRLEHDHDRTQTQSHAEGLKGERLRSSVRVVSMGGRRGTIGGTAVSGPDGGQCRPPKNELLRKRQLPRITPKGRACTRRTRRRPFPSKPPAGSVYSLERKRTAPTYHQHLCIFQFKSWPRRPLQDRPPKKHEVKHEVESARCVGVSTRTREPERKGESNRTQHNTTQHTTQQNGSDQPTD